METQISSDMHYCSKCKYYYVTAETVNANQDKLDN
jgi:hypothetical protein